MNGLLEAVSGVRGVKHDFKGASRPVLITIDATKDVRLAVSDTLRKNGFQAWPLPDTNPYRFEVAMRL